MMFGWRIPFDYLECSRCGCVQLIDPPADLSKYYPENYYSFAPVDWQTFSPLKAFLMKQRSAYCLGHRNILGKMVVKKTGIPDYLVWLQKAKIDLNSSILDVGCGNGAFLATLRRAGFTNLAGADPYMAADIMQRYGIRGWKASIEEIDQEFDFVILNHAFEHIPKPWDVMLEIKRILKPNRYALIRIPVASSYAWKKYGVHWVQLDPPRHLFIHTVDSMQLLADRAGLKLADVVYDSWELQFTGSEKYLKGIAMTDKKGDTMFSQEDHEKFQKHAEALNREGQGDQAGFYLYKE